MQKNLKLKATLPHTGPLSGWTIEAEAGLYLFIPRPFISMLVELAMH